jgi:RNA polymerase sigma factor (sigma-70 family)
MLTDDSAIINACLDGESEAFGILVDKYKAGIFAFVYAKLGNFDDAEDVSQEVFLEAYRKLRSLRKWESFSFWLYRIASTLCKNWKKKQSKYPDSEHFEDLSSEILANPSINSYRENVLYESVRDELNSLPEIYREVLILHYFVGMDSKEIAKSLGTSPTAIRMRISRAREQLREEMIAIMGTAFSQQKLQAKFTFNIVEVIKRIKINPISQTPKGLPWGLSLATGLLIAVISINPMLVSFVNLGTPIFSPLPSETKVLKIGEIPVDVVKTSNIAFISSHKGKGKGGEPKQLDENAFFMAPQAEGGTWTKKNDMPVAKHGLSTCTIDDKIYVIGGAVVNGGIYASIATVEEYDPKNDSWTKKADMPTPRDLFGASVVNGKIYAIGGETMAGGGGWLISAVEEYDPKKDKWTKKANIPTARCGASTVAVNGKIYVIGGLNGKLQAIPNVEEYDPIADVWTKKADIPTAKAGSASVVIDGKIFLFGGQMGWWNGNPVFSTVEEYNPVTDTWVEKSKMPSPLVGSSACVINDKVYIFGGENPNKAVVALSTVYEYDPVNDKWTAKPDMPTAMVMLSTSSANGKIYALGGAFENAAGLSIPLPSVLEYTPEGWQSVSPSGKFPTKWGRMKAAD